MKKLLIIFISIFSAIEVSADTLDSNKEIDLYALSQKYPRCTSTSYRDECYDLDREKGFSMEGYWRENKLWDGVYTNTTINEIVFKYFDGTQVLVGPTCLMNLQGWYVCKGGDKFKPVNGGTLDKDGKRQGEFIVKFSNGNVYEGNYENSNRHGYGKFTWYHGSVYEGNWENGAQHGYGKKTWVSGNVYEGNYENNARHGYGKYTWASGDVYEGNYEKGVRHGYGKYTWASGDVYEGNYENGAQHGYGKFTWANGDVYEGNYEKGARHGYGKITWSDGETYQGEWRNGEMVD